MKKRNLVLLMLCLVLEIVVLKGQSDLQWYIYNEDGKNGTIAGVNNYSVDLNGNNFSILGVKHPKNLPQKNDIFIIYTNGKHFNSRYQNDFYLVETSGTNTGYYFQCAHTPLALYFTDLYEGEDDPPLVSIYNGQAGALEPTSITVSNPIPILTANHDAVPAKDITVIIKNPNKDAELLTLELEYDETVLNPSAIFPNNHSAFPRTDYVFDLTNGKVSLTFNAGQEHQYVNFKTNSSIPDGKDSLIFTLKNGTTQIASLTEQIRQSHDPNYVEVLNIFEKNPREYWAHMHVQCYNDSRESHVNDAQIALSFPATVDASTLEMTDWSYGLTKGGLTQVALVKNTDRVYFNFSNVPDILNMQGPDYYYVDPSQVGWVEFIVKINSTDPSEVANINLRPLRPMTFFDGTPYNITKFIDRCFGNLSDRNDLCERKIESSYYMNQFVETLSIEESRAVLTAGSSNYSDHQVKQCEKDKCSKKDCEKKCKKRRNRFWKRALPWVIAGVMTVIAIAD